MEPFSSFSPTPNPGLALAERAKELSDQLEISPQQAEASLRIAKEMKAEFNQRAQYFADVERKYHEGQKLIAKLQREHEQMSAAAAGGASRS